jgi:ankyrin repeat protein
MRSCIDAIERGDVASLVVIIEKSSDYQRNHHLLHPHSARPCVALDDIVDLLIEVGSDENCIVASDVPRFCDVVYRETRIVQLLIAAGADVIKRDSDGMSLLHIASGRGYIDLLKLLISSGADVNSTTINGNTACHFAAANGRARVLDLLVDAGADVNVANGHGATPCHFAINSGVGGVGVAAAIKRLVAAGASIQEIDMFGRYYCHWAAVRGSEPALLVCIAAGADLHAADRSGNTPFQLASKLSDDFASIELLKAATGDQNAPAALALRRKVAHIQLDFIRERATEICLAMQCADLPALITSVVLDVACRGAHLVPMHLKWKLITAIKHCCKVGHRRSFTPPITRRSALRLM